MSGPLHVLLVGNFLFDTLGTLGVCEQLANELRAAGWAVSTTSSRRGRAARLVDMAATVWSCGRRCDVVHIDVFSGAAFTWAETAAAAASLVGTPYVLTLHGGALPEFSARWPGRMRRLLTGAAAVTAPSRFLREAMAPFRPDTLLLPNPVDAARFHFRHRERPTPRLVWLRAFHGIYAPDVAPIVLALVRRTFPRAHLTMIGPDKGDGSRERTLDVARREGVADGIDLPGAVERAAVAGWLDSHDVFLNTTTIDNTPLSVIEALASGLPVVSTDAGGLRWLLDEGQDALLVPVGDAAAMADAVERVLTEPGLAGRLSATGRQKAMTFDWSVLRPAWCRLLTEAAASRPRRRTSLQQATDQVTGPSLHPNRPPSQDTHA